jgi:hypothetical protein
VSVKSSGARTARSIGLTFALASAGSCALLVGLSSDVNAQPPTPAPAPACTTPKTSCDGADGYYVASGDREKLTPLVEPILLELRTCLDELGAKQMRPSVVVRFDSTGAATQTTVEAPGFESQPCVARVMAKLARLKNANETKIRCDYGCPKPAPPPVPTTSPPTASGGSDDAGDAGLPASDAGPSAPAAAKTDEEEGRTYRFAAKGQAGYELGVMYARPIHSARFRLGLGRQNDNYSQFVIIDGRYGQTPNGLGTWDIRLGGEVDLYRSGILRIGLGAASGLLILKRATTPSGALIGSNDAVALTIGMDVHAGADLVRWGPRNDHALTIDARLDLHVFFTGYYVAPGVVLGLRY